MADVRAKFYVAEVTRFAHDGGKGGKVVLHPATRGAVNASFASATPSGRIELTITNPAAFVLYEQALGREFYVDFSLYHPQAGDGHAFVESPEGHYNHGRCAECGAVQGEH